MKNPIRVKAAMVLLAIFAFAACGASEAGDTSGPQKLASSDQQEASRIDAQHDALCSRVCKRLSECSVQYAEENLSPSVAAEMSKPESQSEQMDECQDTRPECVESERTQKGANQTGQCLRENNECTPLMACLKSNQASSEL